MIHPISGYGAIWGSVISMRSAVQGAGGNVTLDTLAPGAFAAAIQRHKAAGTAPKMHLDHDLTTACVGRWTEFYEDDRGLRMVGVIDLRTEEGNAAKGLIDAGLVIGLSIGRANGRAHLSNAGLAVITESDLDEVSLAQAPVDALALLDHVRMLPSPIEQRLAAQLAAAQANGAG